MSALERWKKKNEDDSALPELASGAMLLEGTVPNLAGMSIGQTYNQGRMVRKGFTTGNAGDNYAKHIDALLGKEFKRTGSKFQPGTFIPPMFDVQGELPGSEPRTVHTNRRGLIEVMHELGHAGQKADNSMLMQAVEKMGPTLKNSRMARMEAVANQKPWRAAYEGIKGIPIEAARSLVDIPLEADAWRRAFKMTDRPALRKMMIKGMIPGMSSYLARGGLYGLGLGLAGKGVYDLLTND